MRRKHNYKYLLILLLLVSVGYAAIATTLKINGSADVKSARWNVYWDENSIAVTNGSVETSQGNGARVTDAGKTQIEYSVELSEPGDFYEFTVDAVNEGSLNAKIAPNGVKNNVYESDGTTLKNLPNYIGYTIKYAENDRDVTEGDVLEAKRGNTPTRKRYKVRVWYKTDIDPSTLNQSTTETMKLVFEVDYVQGEKTGTVKILRGTKGNLQPGDMVGIGDTEDFYVISSDNSANGKTVLLAKYNLLVGNTVLDISTVVPIDSTTQGYGLQSSEARGVTDGSNWTGQGTVSFSNSTYWMPYPPLSILEAYSEDDTIYYDTNSGSFKYRINNEIAHANVYDSNSDIYPYISGENGYVNKLKTMGAPSTITGRLLKYSEANAAKNVEDNGISIIFNGYQTYWLGSTSGYSIIDFIFSNYNDFTASGSQSDSMCGVRPVIEIYTSDIG